MVGTAQGWAGLLQVTVSPQAELLEHISRSVLLAHLRVDLPGTAGYIVQGIIDGAKVLGLLHQQLVLVSVLLTADNAGCLYSEWEDIGGDGRGVPSQQVD